MTMDARESLHDWIMQDPATNGTAFFAILAVWAVVLAVYVHRSR